MAVIQNRIVNGGFELGLFDWITQDVTIVNEPTNEGFAAALLKGGNLNPSLIQSVQAGPGDTFEFMMSLTKDDIGTTPIVSVSITYFSAANAVLGNGLIEIIRLPDTAVREYQTVYGITSPAPPGTARAQLTIVRLAITGTAGILLDQVVLNQIITDASGAVPILFPDVPTEDQQSSNTIELRPFPNDTNLLSLDVTTTQPNQRVKIDSFIEMNFDTAPASGFGFGIIFTLRRDDQTVLSMAAEELLALVGVVTGPLINLNNSIYPNITFIDVVPNPGTYNYNLFVSVQENVGSAVFAGSRAIHAIVYPPGA